MLNQRRDAAVRVAGALISLEDAIDTAITASAELNGLMPQARKDANVSALLGHDAFEEAVVIHTALATARRAAVNTHKHLSEAKHQMGLDDYFPIGDTRPKPPTPGGLSLVDPTSEAA